MVVTYEIHVAFIEGCRSIAIQKSDLDSHSSSSRISTSDLFKYRDRVVRNLKEDQKNRWYRVRRVLGFHNKHEQLFRVLNLAVDVVQASPDRYDQEFRYTEFDAFYLRVESRWPWKRRGVYTALGRILLFYAFTPFFFCTLLGDRGVCPIEEGRPSAGWVTSLYFASATLTTVGYGDFTVEKDKPWHVLAGILYMLLANVTLIASVSKATNGARNPFAKWFEKMADRVLGEVNNTDGPMHTQLRRVRFLRLAELVGGFFLLNALGIFANRLFLLNTDTDELATDWTWLTSIYWAVQTTTTIGYGDLDQPYNQRFFQVFYMIASTYFVGIVFAGLAGLQSEIDQVHRHTAWSRREVSRHLIDELKTEENDGNVGQYEFLVASLVQLGKLSSKDVIPIMEKYRSMANAEGFIAANEAMDTDIEGGGSEEDDPFEIMTNPSNVRRRRAGASEDQSEHVLHL